ncbi:MAG: hypothetical protein CM1200mP30_12470 [Pseudomonadota bacterium]|nr:MAG: hypothetical protein CM1200mP30_12470 [Pseudomonadota bacterium]
MFMFGAGIIGFLLEDLVIRYLALYWELYWVKLENRILLRECKWCTMTLWNICPGRYACF